MHGEFVDGMNALVRVQGSQFWDVVIVSEVRRVEVSGVCRCMEGKDAPVDCDDSLRSDALSKSATRAAQGTCSACTHTDRSGLNRSAVRRIPLTANPTILVWYLGHFSIEVNRRFSLQT